jgi:hypothetical protein
MYISPDIHIVISVSEEVVLYTCATIGFAVAVWGIVKMAQIIFRNSKGETNANSA